MAAVSEGFLLNIWEMLVYLSLCCWSSLERKKEKWLGNFGANGSMEMKVRNGNA